MAGFPKVHYNHGSVHIHLDLSVYDKRSKEAQAWLGDRVLEDSRAYMPIRTGSMRQRSHTRQGGRQVVYPGPYAGMMYRGKVMVDSETGKGPRRIPTGPGEYVWRFRKGAKLAPTQRPLKYSDPNAVPEWFEYAKKLYKRFWVDGIVKIMRGN